jgi:Raf kinase inhibitor-like YbhB/YbcL family protein
MKPLVLVLVLVAIAGCSSDGGTATPQVDAPSADAASPSVDAAPTPTVPPPVPLSVTSTAFADLAAIPTDNTCNGANTSPPLAWTGAPATTKSFAIVLTDQFLSPPLVHWVIYNIPASATGVPASIENTDTPASVAGAGQVVSLHAPTIGYYGPCPPSPPAHSYQFTVHALDVAQLAGVTKDTSRDAALLAIVSHEITSGTLHGMYTTPK